MLTGSACVLPDIMPSFEQLKADAEQAASELFMLTTRRRSARDH